MQVSKIMCAVALLAAGVAANAAPNGARVAYSSGASAIKGNITQAMGALCTAAGGRLTEFASGSNISTYVCATTAGLVGGAGGTYATSANTSFINFQGTPYAEFRLNVAGGSFTAIQVLNGVADTWRDPATLTNTATVPAGAVAVGGVLDVEPGAFPAEVIGSFNVPASFSLGVGQAFGVAVSNKLYTAMFNRQKNTVAGGGATVNRPIPNGCLVTDTQRVECVPTISKGQMATIMNGDEFNAAYQNGAGYLGFASAEGDLAGETLVYARRVSTSGTQAAAQNYFLGNVCSLAQLPVVPEPDSDEDGDGGLRDFTLGAVKVLATPGTGDVRTALAADAYVVGVMSGENNQTGVTWKWVKVQGAPMAENATPGTSGNTNKATVLNGGYDFFFETVYAGGSTAGNAFWSRVATALNTLPAPTGLVNGAQLADKYSKGGSTCKFNSGASGGTL